MSSHPLHQAYVERVPRWLQNRAVARLLGLPQTLGLLSGVTSDLCFERVVDHLGLQLHAEHLERVPAFGPLVVAPNHPFPFVDLCAVSSLLEQVRGPQVRGPQVRAPRVRAVVDDTSDALVELHPLLLFVGRDAEGRARFWDQALEHLGAGGAVVIFPAGRSVYRDRRGRSVEPAWHRGAIALAERSGSPLVPAHVQARTGRVYNLLRRHVDRQAVKALNLNQVHRRNTRVRVRFGSPLDPRGLTPDRLRDAVYALDPDARFTAG